MIRKRAEIEFSVPPLLFAAVPASPPGVTRIVDHAVATTVACYEQEEQYMPALGQTSFSGKSGKKYRFKVYPLCTRIRKIPGLYIIASRSHDDMAGQKHEALYVGQTEDLSQPFDKHHKAQEFERCGANCICLHADESEQSRMMKEQDLVSAMHPVCND